MNFLSIALKESIENNLDIWVGETVSYCNGRETGRNEVRDEIVINTSQMTAQQYIRPVNALNCCYAKVYNRKAIGKTRFNANISMGEDVLFSFYCIAKPNLKVSFRKIDSYVYRLLPTGLHMQLREKNIDEFVFYSKQMLHLFDNENRVKPKDIDLWYEYQISGILHGLRNLQINIIHKVKSKRRKLLLKQAINDKEIREIAVKGGIKYKHPYLWIIDEYEHLLQRAMNKIMRMIKHKEGM